MQNNRQLVDVRFETDIYCFVNRFPITVTNSEKNANEPTKECCHFVIFSRATSQL